MCPSQREKIIREGQEEKKGSSRWDRWAAIYSVVASGLFASYQVARSIGGGFDPKVHSSLVVPITILFGSVWIVGGYAFVTGRPPQRRFIWSLIFLGAATLLYLLIWCPSPLFPKR